MTNPSRKIVVSQDDTERFWNKVSKSDGCWLWAGALVSKGYGAFGVNGGWVYAHRYSWTANNGTIPSKLLVLHSCDTPACVRPDHLFLGTASDNMKDMAAKGRGFHIGQSRKPRCDNGHEFTEENTYRRPDGKRRSCKACEAEIKSSQSAYITMQRAIWRASKSAMTWRR